MVELLTIKEASDWASNHVQKRVTTSNISYLIQYGKIKKYGVNGNTSVDKAELIRYYQNFNGKRETDWKNKLGFDLNWSLSFDYLKEKDTTKHVHRLHPYKGKFIPQLVKYFLDDHTDNFKKQSYFKQGDIILDPFCGSGTTMVQGNELGMHIIGFDISAFNVLISNVKVSQIDFQDLRLELDRITHKLKQFVAQNNNLTFENELLSELNIFNKEHFPSPDFKIKVHRKEIIEKTYATEHATTFVDTFNHLVQKYNLVLRQSNQDSFLGKWFLLPIRKEIDFIFAQVKEVKNPTTKK